MDRAARLQALHDAMRDRILVLDGAWGSLIQRYGLEDADFRGTRFANWPADLKGNPDLLNLTRPDIVREIHDRYIEAGCDITSTNTFTSNRIAQADYRLEDVAQEMNEAGARIAREAADAAQARDGRLRWVAGSIGPTNRTASISPDVNDPGARNVTFEELRAAYAEAVRGLMDGGADILLIETITDTLNAKAAVFAAEDVFEERGEEAAIILSGTIVDRSGRTLSGQTLEAFWTSLAHAKPLAIGLNCALGPQELRAHIAELARIADVPVAAYPNAGLPNEFGGYDETPDQMAAALGAWAGEGIVNIVGSCCGSTPEHTRAIVQAVRGLHPHVVPDHRATMQLSGLEAVEIGA